MANRGRLRRPGRGLKKSENLLNHVQGLGVGPILVDTIVMDTSPQLKTGSPRAYK